MLTRNPTRDRVDSQWKNYLAYFNRGMWEMISRDSYPFHNMHQEFLIDLFNVKYNGRYSDVTDLVLDCEIKEISSIEDHLQISLEREISDVELGKFTNHFIDMLSFFYPIHRKQFNSRVLESRGYALVDFGGEVINSLRIELDDSGQPILRVDRMARRVADDYYALITSTILDRDRVPV